LDGFDAVVVGSGPNGLVAAVRLAEAGRRVLVVEAAAVPGGGLRSEELTLPGFRHGVCATVLPLAVASPAFRALDLGRDGVEFAHPDVPAGHPLEDGPAALAGTRFHFARRPPTSRCPQRPRGGGTAREVRVVRGGARVRLSGCARRKPPTRPATTAAPPG
jgi:phytoene dehydrogenase-like protein